MKLTAYSRRVYIDLHTGKITTIGHQMTEITIWMQNARNCPTITQFVEYQLH